MERCRIIVYNHIDNMPMALKKNKYGYGLITNFEDATEYTFEKAKEVIKELRTMSSIWKEIGIETI
jgi:hypothetical protein